MKSQYFAEPFLDDIAKWEKTIGQINENVDLLLQVQKQWMYLESIFVGQEDVKKQLANEESLFRKFNNSFME
jgi:dynein heavy chain